jgi:hypothetical protein
MPASEKKAEAKLIKSASGFGKALVLALQVKGKPNRRVMDAMQKHALAMVRSNLRLKLAAEQNDKILNAPIQNKGGDYVTAHREEKLRALLRKYRIDPSSSNAYYSLSLQLAIDFHTGFKEVAIRQPKRPQWSGRDGRLLTFLIAKIRTQSKTDRSTTSLVRELKRQFPELYGDYSDQTLKVRYFKAIRGQEVRYFEAIRGQVAVR